MWDARNKHMFKLVYKQQYLLIVVILFVESFGINDIRQVNNLKWLTTVTVTVYLLVSMIKSVHRGLSSKFKAISDDSELVQYTVNDCKWLKLKVVRQHNTSPVDNCK